MRVTFYQSAGTVEIPGKGTFPQRFAPGCFDGLLGQTVPWTARETDDGPLIAQLGSATVVSIEISADGAGAVWTVDLSDEQRGTERVQLPPGGAL